jgi:dipeptidyl aminopeptidase/acylaminoacyl peptidase
MSGVLATMLALASSLGSMASLAHAAEGARDLSERSLLEVRDLGGLSLAPNGRYVAARIDAAQLDGDSYRLEWVLLDRSSGAVLHRADGGLPIFDPGGLLETAEGVWSADSRLFVFRALQGGRVVLVELAVDTGKTRTIVEEPADIGRFALSESGAIIYQTGATRDELVAAERREFAAGTRIDKSVSVIWPIVGTVPRNGQRLTLRLGGDWGQDDHGLIDPEPANVHALDLATGARRMATPLETKALNPSLSAPAWRERRALATQVASTARYAALRKFEDKIFQIGWSSPSQPLRLCEAPECRGKVSPIAWSDDGDTLFFRRNEPLGKLGTYGVSIATGRVKPVLETNETLGVSRWRQGYCPVTQGRMICVVASAVSPPQLIEFTLRSGARRILLDPNQSLRASIRAKAERLVWRSSLGDETYGYLITPSAKAEARRPLVITQYVCDGFLRGGTGDEVPEVLLAKEGVAALCVADLVSDNPRKGLRHPEQQAVWASFEALIEDLAARGDIDMDRLGIAGLSSGADKTLYAISHSGIFKAAAVGGPTVDPILSYIAGIPGNRLLDYMPIYGVPPYYLPNEMSANDKARWNELSPALRANQITTPLLMQLADSEVVMAMQLYSALTALRRSVDAYVYADELHLKRHPSHRSQVYRRNLDWFCYWLQDKRRPGNDAQYAIWDALPRAGLSAPDTELLLGPDNQSLRTLKQFNMTLPK